MQWGIINQSINFTLKKKQKLNISDVEVFALVWKPCLRSLSMLQKYLSKLEFYASVQTEFPLCAHTHNTAIN